MSKQKTSKQLFEEIYDLCAEQMDSGNYDSLLLEISSLANEGKDTTDPALNLHGVNDLLVDFQHYLVLDGALDIEEDEIKRNAEVFSTNRR